MPAIDNPHGIAATLPGQIAKIKRDLKDLSAATIGNPNVLNVGAGGLTVVGPSSFTGGVTGAVTASGVVSGSALTTAGALTSGSVSTGAVSGSSFTASSTAALNADCNVGGNFRALSVYNTVLASTYRAVWVTGVDGQLGYVPSSRQFKQDIQQTALDPVTVLKLQLVTFRYIAAVNSLGDAAAIELGLIAEDVDALGLTTLVDYDEAGKPFGVKYERLALLLLQVVQDQSKQLDAIKARLDKAGI